MQKDLSCVVDALPGLVWTALPDGQIDFLNQRWCEYTGLNVDKACGLGWQTAIHPEDLPELLERWQSILASDEPGEMEARLRRFDGEYRWFLFRIRPLADASGQVVKWCGINTEIEDRRQAEEGRGERWWLSLPRRENLFRSILDGLPAVVTLMTPDGELEHANRHMLEYFGKTLEELKARAVGYSFHPDDRPAVLARWRESVETGHPYDFEARLRRADGVYRWFHTRGFPLRDSEGRIVLWYLLQTDVDDRRRAEEALRAREGNLNLIISTIPVLAWSARPDGTAEFFNQNYLDYVGLSKEQAQDWRWTDAVHPDDLKSLAASWQSIMTSGKPGESEGRLRRFDGEYRWFLFRANPLRDDSGNIAKWYGVNTDIEDRKRAEEALRASELNLRQMTETIPEMLWSATPEGAIDYCNTRFLNYTGFSSEEVMDNGWQKTIHPDDAIRVAPVWMASVRTGALYRVEVRTFYAADRTYRWCLVSALPLLDQQGRIQKWHGTIVDMHDWKLAQEELRRSEAFLAEAQRLSSTGSFSWRIATDEIAWSSELYRIFEFDLGVPVTLELIGSRVRKTSR